MHLPSIAGGLAVSFTLLSTVLASPAVTPAQGNVSKKPAQTFTTPTTTACFTQMKYTQNKKPTTRWSTWTTSCTQTSTVTVTSTSTPAATSTSTVTTTATSTAPTTTSTATVTSIVTSTSTTTTVTVTTTTQTATTTTSIVGTSTIPASAAFTPIETSLPGTTNQQTVTKLIKKKRGVSANVKVNVNLGSKQPGFSRNVASVNDLLSVNSSPPTYRGDVDCHRYVGKCAIVTTTVTQTTTAAPTTSVVTSTSTVTTTTTPGASTTVTTTSTVTATTTLTSTNTVTTVSTTTETSTTSTVTSYQACATANQGNYYNNQGITGGVVGQPFNQVQADAGNASPYDCCVQGILDPLGALYGHFYNDFTTGSSGICILVEDFGQCSGQNDGFTNTVLYDQGATPLVALGNLNCGLWNAASS